MTTYKTKDWVENGHTVADQHISKIISPLLFTMYEIQNILMHNPRACTLIFKDMKHSITNTTIKIELKVTLILEIILIEK